MLRSRARSHSLHRSRVLTLPRSRALIWISIALLSTLTVLLFLQQQRPRSAAPRPPVVRPKYSEARIERVPRAKAPRSDALNGTQGAACFSDGCSAQREPEPVREVSLLVGVISASDEAELRAAARRTWVQAAAALPAVRVLFFAATPTQAFLDEQATHGDVLLSDHEHDDMPVAFRMLAQLAKLTTVQNVLRVDVGSYVAVPRLLAALEAACEEPACRNQAVWAGALVSGAPVESQHAGYQQATGLPKYAPYMRGEAYVISHSLVRALVLMHGRIGLKDVGPDEVAMGLWLLPIPVHRVDLSAAVHLGPGCCVDAASRRPSVDVCGSNPAAAAILGGLEAAAYVHAYHDALQAC